MVVERQLVIGVLLIVLLAAGLLACDAEGIPPANTVSPEETPPLATVAAPGGQPTPAPGGSHSPSAIPPSPQAAETPAPTATPLSVPTPVSHPPTPAPSPTVPPTATPVPAGSTTVRVVPVATALEKMVEETLRSTSSHAPESVQKIRDFPWFQDGITNWESGGISALGSMLREYNEFGMAVLDLWWVQDDITAVESRSLDHLRNISRADLPFAWEVIAQPFLAPPFRYRDEFVLGSLDYLSSDNPFSTRGPDLRQKFSGRDWFNDGIDDLESVLVYAIEKSPDDFGQALFDRNFVASREVHLPLAGPVEIIVVRHTPFPDADPTFTYLEEGLRAVEGFVGAPFPLSDIILVLTEPEIWNVGSGKHYSYISGGTGVSTMEAFLMANNSENGPRRNSIYHELAHHYYMRGTGWTSEGAANFLEAFALSVNGGQGLDERMAQLQGQRSCSRANIQEHIDSFGGEQCDYHLGELFFLGMLDAMGQDAVAGALRDLNSQSRQLVYLSEEVIYHSFATNVPPGQEEAFKAAYRRYHGGTLVDRDPLAAVDRLPLAALYHSAGGTGWTRNANWDSDAPLGTWHGVITDPQGRVRKLELDRNGLSGPIAPEFGGLSDLRGLRMSRNSLTGEIPPSLGNLSRLVNLFLGGNSLEGGIPPELGNLPEIQTIFLWENRLTGSIPPELGRLQKLRILDVQFNGLSGQIPPELAEIPTLESLWLKGNRFTGCIPAALYSVPRNDLDQLGLPICQE